MTYTINQDVDVNAQVDIGNIQVLTNTISSTNTNGNILLSPNGTGKVAIGTATPDRDFVISKNTSCYLKLVNTLSNNYIMLGAGATSSGTILYSRQTDDTTPVMFSINQGSLGNTVNIDTSGNVGIGTSSPYAKLHVNGTGNTSTILQTGNRRYFGYDTAFVTGTNVGGDPANTISIYAINRIVTGTYIVSHSNTTFSDRRIKDNIVDVEDDTCLQKLRLIKPKQYTYKDTKGKGTAPVWGFIAQEVAETLDYAVDKMKKAIPNVYKLASVSEDGTVLTFEEPVTLEIMDTTKLQLKTLVSEELDVTVSEVLSPTSIRLTEAITEDHHTGTLGDESIVRKVFVYGQWVDDFHVLKKDAIFTVAVAALQEVDRRQTTDNERILELEGDLTEAQETIATQAQDIATLQAQVAALMQHTGVTI